ncbi:metal dependent phosphohydrolase [Shewanella sediminis HAW-EB3]|uniref:Metal dependent phosphohydrolase n=1 Tax=Shewanella sediminis (strain HAW-EB3) TaxID=425104 RepID=A8FQZ4_SHESH|nr:MBL fold metallo-hydrolase [Shewanella sediminis]ABV35267.1 metal dependent phosphohydrolase [Shewanella sediminis HAW-EB3]
MINIERYEGTEANVNSYILSDDENTIVVDALRNSTEAESLADHIETKGKKLNCIFITHGHADHYMGLGVLHRRFPNVPIKVATSAIKEDLIGFSQWMESVGWLEGEPLMKVKTTENPEGFDYANLVSVIDEPFLTLPLEANRIHVHADYPGNECGHMTTLTIPEQKAFLASDLLYDKVHAWCGPGTDRQEIHQWIDILNEILEMEDADKWTFYSGHGQSGDQTLVTNMKGYLEQFLKITESEKTQQAAMDKLTAAFPGFAQDDFLLVHSVNYHVKETA